MQFCLKYNKLTKSFNKKEGLGPRTEREALLLLIFTFNVICTDSWVLI